MRKVFIIAYLLTGWFFTQNVSAQSYDDVLNYNLNGTPVNGVKIKTNIPYENGAEMPTIIIEGYNYRPTAAIGLTIVWYVYGGTFYDYSVSSWGNYTPPIYLSDENGFVSIFIQDKSYYQRFKVMAYAQGMSETSSWFQGWSVLDQPLGGTNQVLVPYQNSFAGTVSVAGSFTVSKSATETPSLDINASSGNVLIGKTSQTNTSYKLDVNGNIRANKVTVNATGADYVFDSAFRLPSLDSLNNYLKMHHHLPGIPSAKEMQQYGINVGEAYTKLLAKLEEMTEYMIREDQLIADQAKKIKMLNEKIEAIQDNKNK